MGRRTYPRWLICYFINGFLTMRSCFFVWTAKRKVGKLLRSQIMTECRWSTWLHSLGKEVASSRFNKLTACTCSKTTNGNSGLVSLLTYQNWCDTGPNMKEQIHCKTWCWEGGGKQQPLTQWVRSSEQWVRMKTCAIVHRVQSVAFNWTARSHYSANKENLHISVDVCLAWVKPPKRLTNLS